MTLFKTDREIAEDTGKLADAHSWLTHGRPLEKFPFFVTAAIHNTFTPSDAMVEARERKTLGDFGFTPGRLRHVGGAWLRASCSSGKRS